MFGFSECTHSTSVTSQSTMVKVNKRLHLQATGRQTAYVIDIICSRAAQAKDTTWKDFKYPCLSCPPPQKEKNKQIFIRPMLIGLVVIPRPI